VVQGKSGWPQKVGVGVLWVAAQMAGGCSNASAVVLRVWHWCDEGNGQDRC
jgi:hypothetical protein